MELIRATRKLLADTGSSDKVGDALGIGNHFVADIEAGKIYVTMDDVTHWIAFLALKKNYPSLRGYASSDSAGLVVTSLELLIRAG